MVMLEKIHDDTVEALTKRITYFQYQELSALKGFNDAIGGPSHIHTSQWRGLYQSLVRLGLVIWESPPVGFSKRRFAGATVSELGCKVLARIAEIDAGEDYSDDDYAQ
jgi:hypothetical protein